MNNYQIYEEIGRGRHSTVYKGRLKKTVEYYAIKSVDKAQRSRVLNEVTMLHQLRHANILHFYHWYETNNHLWLIEEYCTGSDVLTLIKQDKSLPEDTLVTFATDLLSALNFIHSKGIIYCDLKPSNILIDAHGFLKLSDFGLACHIDDVTAAKRKIGTPTYMAPELFQEGGVPSFASDLWSLGIVLYEIYVGKPPFVDKKLDGLIHNIVYEDYVRPTGCSRGFIDVLEGLLEKDPLERLDWVDLPNHEFWKDKTVLVVTTQQPAFEAYKNKRMAEGTTKSSKEVKEARERRRQQVARISATAQQNMVREQQSTTYDRKGEGGFEANTEIDFGTSQHEEGEEDLPAGNEQYQEAVAIPDTTLTTKTSSLSVKEVKQTEEQTTTSTTTSAPTIKLIPGDFNSLLFHLSDTHVKPIMCNTRVERLTEVKYDAESLPFPPHSLQDVCNMQNGPLEQFLTLIYKAIGGHTTIGEKQNCLAFFETLCGATITANLFINSLIMALFVKMVQNKNYPPGLKSRLCLIMGLLIRHATFINHELAKTGIISHLLSLFNDKNVKVKRRAVACLGELLFYIATQQPGDRNAWNTSQGISEGFCAVLNSEDEATRHYTVKTIENIAGHSDVVYTQEYATAPLIKALLLNFNGAAGQTGTSKQCKNEYLRSSAISSVARICRIHHHCLPLVISEMGASGLVAGLSNGSNTRTLQSCLNILSLILSKACLILSKKVTKETKNDNLLKFVNFATQTATAAVVADGQPQQQQQQQQQHEHIFKNTVLADADAKAFLTELELQSQQLIHGLMASLEHSSVVIRGKTLLALSLLTVCDISYLSLACSSRLTPLLERLSKETDNYISACFETVTSILSAAALLVVGKLKQCLTTREPIDELKGQISIVLHTLTAPTLRTLMISSELIELIADCLSLSESNGGDNFCMQQLLLVTESMSQDLQAMETHAAAVVKHLLKVLTILLESRHGDTRFMSLKICIDVLVPYLHASSSNPTTISSDVVTAIDQLIVSDLFPKLIVLLDDEEPIPLYGLKLLNSIATENVAYVKELAKKHWAVKLFAFFELEHRNNNVHNVKLVLKVVTSSTTDVVQIFELGVIAKLNNVLSYAFQNSVVSFFEPCLEICHCLLSGTKKAKQLYNEKKDKESTRKDYQMRLSCCAGLVQNVELYAMLSISAEPADIAAQCLLLCSQLYTNVELHKALISERCRKHFRSSLTEHSLKGDQNDIVIYRCIIETLYAVITSGEPNQNKEYKTILRGDALLISCIGDVHSDLSTPEAQEAQNSAKALLDLVCSEDSDSSSKSEITK